MARQATHAQIVDPASLKTGPISCQADPQFLPFPPPRLAGIPAFARIL